MTKLIRCNWCGKPHEHPAQSALEALATCCRAPSKITNDDLWAAIRGLALYRETDQELEALLKAHEANPMFASQVIAEAVRQVMASRKFGVKLGGEG